MTTLTNAEARLLAALHKNGGAIRWAEMSVSDRKIGTRLDRSGMFAKWIIEPLSKGGHRLEITPKGIEALKGPIG